MRFKKILVHALTCGTSVLSIASMANAQTAPAEAQAPQPDALEGVEDIVVTAQRREQKLQDVPISITAVTAALAARSGVTGTESLSLAVPGLQFSRQTANGGAPFIRGVGSAQAIQGSESPVAVYVDDVYIGSPGASLLAFNNIDQIEVLKGPQGTLFGRNATGGVVHVRTKKPSHDAALDATIGYGSLDTRDASLYATGGVTDTLAVNFAGSYHKQDNGYGRNIYSGADIYKTRYRAVRSEAYWTPTDDTELLLIGDYSKTWSDIGLNGSILPGTVALGPEPAPGRYLGTSVPADFGYNTQYGVSARLDHDFGAFRFASISAYRKNHIHYDLDIDGGKAPIIALGVNARNRTISQELQILSPSGGSLQWIAGAFYYNSKAGFLPLFFTGTSQAALGGSSNFDATQTLNSYSGFGEINYEFIPETRLTVGLRYTSDHFSMATERRNAAGTILAPTPFSQDDVFSKFTYRAVLDHHFTQDIMAYGSYSRGFKSGGYNLSAPSITVAGVTVPAPPVEPEVLDAYEIGLKTSLFDRRVRLNLAAFRYDYSDLQVTVVGAGVSTVLNAASAKTKGIEADLEFAPFPGFNVTTGAAFLNAKFARFPNGPFLVANPAGCAPTPRTTGPQTGGNSTCSVDLSGFRTPRSPKFTGNLSASYTLETNSSGSVLLAASLYYNSGFAWDPDNRIKQPKYLLLNSSLAWTSPGKRYEARIWGKNLTNKYYFTYELGTGQRDYGNPAEPRTYGATLSVHT